MVVDCATCLLESLLLDNNFCILMEHFCVNHILNISMDELNVFMLNRDELRGLLAG